METTVRWSSGPKTDYRSPCPRTAAHFLTVDCGLKSNITFAKYPGFDVL